MHAPSVAVPVFDAIMTGPSLTCTIEGPQSPFLMRIGGGTPEKRRETTRNDGNRRETTGLHGGARSTFVGPRDTPSLKAGPVHSFSPADWLRRKILAQ